MYTLFIGKLDFLYFSNIITMFTYCNYSCIKKVGSTANFVNYAPLFKALGCVSGINQTQIWKVRPLEYLALTLLRPYTLP